MTLIHIMQFLFQLTGQMMLLNKKPATAAHTVQCGSASAPEPAFGFNIEALQSRHSVPWEPYSRYIQLKYQTHRKTNIIVDMATTT